MPHVPDIDELPELEEQDDGSDNVVFGDTIVQSDGLWNVDWSWATLGNEEITPGTEDTLLLKSQADALYGALSGGELAFLEVDASTQSVTESMPSPKFATSVVVLRTDTSSSNTGKISDPTNSGNLVWPGRGSAQEFEVQSRQPLLWTSDGTRWILENPAVYEIGGPLFGKPTAQELAFRHKLRHDLYINTLSIDAEKVPTDTGGYDFDVILAGVTVATVTLPENSNSVNGATIGATAAAEEVLKIVTANDTDPNLADISFSFDAHRR